MMLPSSVRRVVSAAPQTSFLSSFAPNAARATASASFSYSPRNQQRRRYSSSKPSSPNNSSKGLPAGQVTAAPAEASESSTTGAEKVEKRKRKPKENTDVLGKLPSVPSTNNVPKEALILSTFFSLHRPMSVTQGFPKTVTDDAFAQIFAPRSKSSKYGDVMSTLSKTVDDLEQPMQSLTLGGQQDAAGDEHHDQMRRIEVRNPDGSESSIYVQLNAMSGQFLPFRPPPIPQPESLVRAETGAEEAVEREPHHRVYKAIFTLEETTDANGEVRILAHSPTLVEEESIPRTFLERMALRQLHRDESKGRQVDDMMAISVRRQRKLKMKKKKYKKLMKRTRNERRKLDRV